MVTKKAFLTAPLYGVQNCGCYKWELLTTYFSLSYCDVSYKAKLQKLIHRPIMAVEAHLPETSLWANRKCLLICAVVAIANMQYGLDSAVIASLQAMPGFLIVFGHPDPESPGGYAIGVRSLIKVLLNHTYQGKTNTDPTTTGNLPTTNLLPPHPRRLPLLTPCRHLRALPRPQARALARVPAHRHRQRDPNQHHLRGRRLRRAPRARRRQRLPRHLL